MSSFEDYKNIIINNPEGQRPYECFIIENPYFSKTYYIVQDNQDLAAKDQNGIDRIFEKASISSTDAQNNDDLSQDATITIADPDNTLDDELDRVPLGLGRATTITYLLYASTNLDEPADFIVYEAKSVPQQRGAFTIKFGVPDLNKDTTGELFDFETFPMLRSI